MITELIYEIAATGMIAAVVAFVVGLITLIVQAVRHKNIKPILATELFAVLLFVSSFATLSENFLGVIGLVALIPVYVVCLLVYNTRKLTAKKAAAKKDVEEKEATAAVSVLEGLSSVNEVVLIKSVPSSTNLFFKICAGIFYTAAIALCAILEADLYIWVTILGAITLVMALIRFLVNWVSKKQLMVVTNKRVYYRFLWKQVDLPLDFITAAGTFIFKGVAVSSPSGVIRLTFIKNNKEIHKVVTDLLLARQGGLSAAPAVSYVPPAPPSPSAPAASSPTPPPPAPHTAAPAAPQAPAGQAAGKCVMCGKAGIPVTTIEVTIAGKARTRTICQECAKKRKSN